jgi:hypothetical protein
MAKRKKKKAKKVFDFQEQLEVGNRGETLFARQYALLNPIKTQDRKFDFVLNDGKLVEVKTDTYSMSRTENFFMEYFSNIDDAKLGGPWRAANDNVDYFVYFFLPQKTFFWFDSKKLVSYLDKMLETYTPMRILNKGWTTLGYLVPREDVRDLVIKEETCK